MAKHTPDRCSLGPTKGLEEKELIALAANKDLSFTYTPSHVQPAPVPAEEGVVPVTARSHSDGGLPPLPLPITSLKSAQDSEEKTLVSSGRWSGVVSHHWPSPSSHCTVCALLSFCTSIRRNEENQYKLRSCCMYVLLELQGSGFIFLDPSLPAIMSLKRYLSWWL